MACFDCKFWLLLPEKKKGNILALESGAESDKETETADSDTCGTK